MSLALLVTHLFVPHSSNNQKAKLLHSESLLSLALIVVIFQLVLQIVPHTRVQILGYAANIAPSEVIKLTNEKRVAAGLPTLSENAQLTVAARAKGAHMLANDYWAHVAPDGTEPWKFFADVGYKYKSAGENLARDFSNPASAVEAWMASPTHKDNLLSARYKEIGVAVVEGDLAGVDTTIIVQLFGTTSTAVASAGTTAAQTSSPTTNPVSAVNGPIKTLVPVTASPEPTNVAMSSPTPQPHLVMAALSPIPETKAGPTILISPFTSTQSVSLVVVGILLIVLIIDGIVVSRRRIERIGGRTMAHIAFLGLIIAITLLLRAGKVI